MEKSGQTKKHKFHEVLDLLCFQSQNLVSGGPFEVEGLHVVFKLPPVCLCAISSKSNKFQGKRASLQNGTLITPLLLFHLQKGLVLQKYTVLSSTIQENVSTALYRQQWTQEGKMTKIRIQVSLRRQ